MATHLGATDSLEGEQAAADHDHASEHNQKSNPLHANGTTRQRQRLIEHLAAVGQILPLGIPQLGKEPNDLTVRIAHKEPPLPKSGDAHHAFSRRMFHFPREAVNGILSKLTSIPIPQITTTAPVHDEPAPAVQP